MMLALLRSRRAAAAGMLTGLLAAAGCGGGGMSVGNADPQATRLDPDGCAAAAFVPVFDALSLALDTSRFIVADVPRLLAAGADESDSLVSLPGRRGSFVLKWYDADRDGALSSGDALRLDTAVAETSQHVPRGGGLHVAELTIGAGGFATPALYADLVPAAHDSTGVSLAGSLSIAYARGAIGERLTVGGGASGLRRVAADGDALLDSLDLILEVQPYSHAWTLRGRASIADARGGLLTLEMTSPLRGALRTDDRPGEVEAGAFVVKRADGGLVEGLVIGPDQVRLRADANGDGIYEESVTAGWSALTGGGH